MRAWITAGLMVFGVFVANSGEFRAPRGVFQPSVDYRIPQGTFRPQGSFKPATTFKVTDGAMRGPRGEFRPTPIARLRLAR